MSRTASFDRLEHYVDKNDLGSHEVRVTFDTRKGKCQFSCDGEDISTPPREPDINMFSQEDQHYIETVCYIVYRMTFDAPAKFERFE
jgi:hypothetical protein